MIEYRVEVDGAEVWSDASDEYLGVTHFPGGFRVRPEDGSVVCLFVNGECIARNVSEATEAAESAVGVVG